MRLPKFLILLVFLTAISLIYVQLQVEIFKQAYVGTLNEVKLRDVLDGNSILMYNILSLKSAQNVGDAFLSNEKDLHFAQKQQIAEFKVPARVVPLVETRQQSENKRPDFFTRVFALKSQAEAKQ